MQNEEKCTLRKKDREVLIQVEKQRKADESLEVDLEQV